MSENSPIKDALYENIEHIGEKQIHQLLLNSKFSELFEKICEPVIQKVKEIEEYEKYGTLAESFTHYLFTEMLIPSQRKILFEPYVTVVFTKFFTIKQIRNCHVYIPILLLGDKY